jgi:uncharacterized MAPEG superfamily protein
MAYIELVTALALAQYLVFATLVGRARGQYGVKAPAVTGHEMFERFYRVQMNTLELMVVFLPALWLAARHAKPEWMAALGAVYLVGRLVYLRAYVSNPGSRGMGFLLSFMPVVMLLATGLLGACKAAFTVG